MVHCVKPNRICSYGVGLLVTTASRQYQNRFIDTTHAPTIQFFVNSLHYVMVHLERSDRTGYFLDVDISIITCSSSRAMVFFGPVQKLVFSIIEVRKISMYFMQFVASCPGSAVASCT